MERAVLLQALDVACAQRAALARGDVEAFIEGMEQQQQTCAALVEAGISDAEEAMLFDDLVGAIRESQAMLDSLMGEVTQRLGHLRVAKTAVGAYLSSPPRSALGTHDA